MPITVLDYTKSIIGEKDTYTTDDFARAGVDILGGCEYCGATLAAYNAYPSKSGYWRCAGCIGSDGFPTVENFVSHESQADRAVTWLLRLRQLQAGGLDFDAALAQANAEAEQDGEPETPLNCPSCGAVENIYLWEHSAECGACGAVWPK
jgi:hypothetical protein